MSKLMIPTVHMNGTGKETLLREYVNAMNALDMAIDALRFITVHGRDYYPQGNDAINDAMAQRASHFEKLEEVRFEIEAIAVAISEQGK
jgi:hypothetical protein